MIHLPDIRQGGSWDCGLVAARVVLGAHRKRLTPPIRAALGSDPVDGTDPRAMETAFRLAGLGVISGEMTLDDLAHQTLLGRPVVCLVTWSTVGHYVVVQAVKADRIHIQDPEDGPTTVSVRTLEKGWRDLHRLGAVYRSWGIATWPMARRRIVRPTG